MPILGLKGLKESTGEVFPVVPAGNYRVRITKIEESETGPEAKYPGSPSLKFYMKVCEGDHENHTFVETIAIPDPDTQEAEYVRQNVAKFKKFCMACGIEPSDDNLDTDEFMGKEFVVVVSERKVDGKARNEIKDKVAA